MPKLVFKPHHNEHFTLYSVRDAEDERNVLGWLELNSENIYEFGTVGKTISTEMLSEIVSKLNELNVS